MFILSFPANRSGVGRRPSIEDIQEIHAIWKPSEVKIASSLLSIMWVEDSKAVLDLKLTMPVFFQTICLTAYLVLALVRVTIFCFRGSDDKSPWQVLSSFSTSHLQALLAYHPAIGSQ